MLIDAYQHVGLPRFQSGDDALTALDTAGIDRALVCAFDTCPDLVEVHRTLLRAPDRIVACGLAQSGDRATVEARVRAQFEAGFSGLRLSGGDIERMPWLLDLIGDAGAIALVCSSDGLRREASALGRMLRDHPRSLVLGGHFAGPTDPAVFDSADVAALFAHERFAVIASRQGLFEPRVLDPWFDELLARVGTERLLWGSEAPVLYWRDETLRGSADWLESRIADPAQLAAIRGGNAERLLFARERPAPAPLELESDPMSLVDVKPAAMWPHGLSVPDPIAGRIVHHWLQSQGGGSTLNEFIAQVLDGALPS
ncbi:amidohydrolase family protein [Gryllotalpicola reticulitermitis]|uniref:Amidohydrolase family protein n=1 Tax=Gryllotalpicola reticulitermitis TaxID=1184153 RepID=A0ABV8Q746_9MICO